MTFISDFSLSPEKTGQDLWFVFRGSEVLVRRWSSGVGMPRTADLAFVSSSASDIHYLGRLNGDQCFAAEVDEHTSSPDGMTFQGLRQLLRVLDEETFSVASRSFQVLHWDRTHRYCGGCGSKTLLKDDERARECPRCGLISYPTVSPAVIVAVTRGEELLLARSLRFAAPFFSVLAGFVEPGETFQECVRREVREEVGIDVKDIRYFGNQPWPFPNSLMVGFTAAHKAGEIKIDGRELSAAGWFKADNLPEIPREGTIARQLIDWFITAQGTEEQSSR